MSSLATIIGHRLGQWVYVFQWHGPADAPVAIADECEWLIPLLPWRLTLVEDRPWLRAAIYRRGCA